MVQPMQMPPTLGTPPIPFHPTPLGHIAFDDRTPTTEFHDAFRGAVLGREVALFVVAGPVAPLVHGLTEQPLRPQHVVERNHRRLIRHLIQQVGEGLRQVVRLDRTARNTHDRQPALDFQSQPR